MKVRLDRPVVPLKIEPGDEVVIKGSFKSTHDGSEIDAAATFWPDGAPGGASVDAGGLVDFAAGGLHLSERDTDNHTVTVLATDGPAPACDAAGVAAPCLVLRTLPLARSRLMTVAEYESSLVGSMSYEIVEPAPPPVTQPVVDAATSPWAIGALGALGVGAAALIGLVAWRKQRMSAKGQLLILAKRVEEKLANADAALSAPLAPAIEAAMKSVRQGKVEASSKEGVRVRDVLLRVEQRLSESERDQAARKEQEAADELVGEMEAALEAAEEAIAVADGPRRK